ncbi:MAG: sigma-70 family RNA polymerase sigma factor [Caldilineaceae bacterium]
MATVGEAKVLAFIRTLNDSPESDLDILQDALMTAYLCVERGAYCPQDGVPFAAYVKGIARNKIREARRGLQREVAWDDSVLTLPANGANQPEELFEAQERRYALQSGLAQLSNHRRTVLEALLGGESTSEIAQSLEMSEEAVRQHKSRGLRSLRQMNQLAQWA